jgi:hypothetical protein
MSSRIVSVVISPIPREVWEPLPVVTATFDDGSTRLLFSYFPDEISFLPREFVGLTEEEARALKAEKDSTYLRGGYIPRFRRRALFFPLLPEHTCLTTYRGVTCLQIGGLQTANQQQRVNQFIR